MRWIFSSVESFLSISSHMLLCLNSRKILLCFMFKCKQPNQQHNSCKLTVVTNGTQIIKGVVIIFNVQYENIVSSD